MQPNYIRNQINKKSIFTFAGKYNNFFFPLIKENCNFFMAAIKIMHNSYASIVKHNVT